MQKILTSRQAWVDSTVLLKHPEVKQILAQGNLPAATHVQQFALAARALSVCGFSTAGLGTNQHGTPVVFVLKRRLLPAAASYALYCNLLTVLDLRVADYQGAPQPLPDKPAAAPDLEFPDEAANVDGPLALLTAWKGRL